AILLAVNISTELFAHNDGTAHAPHDDTKLTKAVQTGSGRFKFKTVPGWGNIPVNLQIGPTHGSAVVDKKGNIYVSTDSASGIFVFSPDGKLLRSMAPEFSGVHGMVIRKEGRQEYIYGAHVKGAQVVKMTLEGKPVLVFGYPADSGLYPEGKGYRPTAVAVAPNGDIFVADGYGKSVIHKFDLTGRYIKTFGVKGPETGQFQTCHGLSLDTRYKKPLLLVCDRENRRLQHFDLDGNFVAVIAKDLRRPCAVSFYGDYVFVAELEGRVTVLDKNNQVITHLGDNPEKSQWAKFDVPPENWSEGIFTAPHGLTTDAKGNLYVQDWNRTGRLTKLVRVK
ncbi:MAG: 6-bladed beta-propeller, partial [Limisphaerales bacterium]